MRWLLFALLLTTFAVLPFGCGGDDLTFPGADNTPTPTSASTPTPTETPA